MKEYCPVGDVLRLIMSAEMEIDTQGNILVTKYMDLVSTTLLMATAMKGHGMKVVSKAMVCIVSGMVIPNVGNGILAPSRTLYLH